MSLVYRSVLELAPTDATLSGIVDEWLTARGHATLTDSDNELISPHLTLTSRSSDLDGERTTEIVARHHGQPDVRTLVLEVASAVRSLLFLEEEIIELAGGFHEIPEISDLSRAVIARSTASTTSFARPYADMTTLPESWYALLPDVLIVGDAPDTLLPPRIAGMAFVQNVSLDDAAQRVSRPITSGSVAVLGADDVTRLVLPRTARRLDPHSSARRIHREVLSCVSEHPTPSRISDAMRRLRLSGRGDRDWMEEAERLLDESDRLEDENRELRRQLDDVLLEAAELAGGLDERQRRVRYLERTLKQYVGSQLDDDADEVESPDITSFADIFEYAPELLSNVWIRPETRKAAVSLDERPERLYWSREAWSALRSLNDYAEAKQLGAAEGNFYAYCSNAPTGWHTFPLDKVAMRESESTMQVPAMREARLFEVPHTVHPSGRLLMEAHIKIAKRGTDVPRLHFYDDTRGSTEKVLVGYVGAHLPVSSGS